MSSESVGASVSSRLLVAAPGKDTMRNLRHIAMPAYLVAALLAIFPLMDLTLVLLPVRVAEVDWRVGAAGLLSRALLTPVLGSLLAFATALLLGQRRVLRVFSILGGMTAGILLAAIALLLLDGLQLRGQVPAQNRTAFDTASLVALGKYVMTAIVMLTVAVAARRASTGERTSDRLFIGTPRDAIPLVVGTRSRR